MRDNDHAVLGDSQVEFERVHAHRQGIGKGLQRVLRAKRAPAAMRLDVEPRVARSRCAARSIPCKSGHKRQAEHGGCDKAGRQHVAGPVI